MFATVAILQSAGSGIPGMLVKDFEAQLDDLSRQHTFISWPDLRAALQEQKPLPASACLLTFDDGVRDHYVNVFRILRDRESLRLVFCFEPRRVGWLGSRPQDPFFTCKAWD